MKKEDKILVFDYNPEWKSQFEELKNILADYLGADIIGIEHVGSTSIPGMKAKPIIDLDILIEDNNSILEKVISKLKELGYLHLGEMGITGREAFERLNSTTPNLGSKKQWFKHNLYLCKKGSVGLSNHLNLRNYLKENPNKVIEYSELKQKLANKFPFDINSYVDGKTNFIVEILNETGMKTIDTQLIKKQNKLKVD
jgi:GrpB-like predicted nucleotidyltransferase (UPF0157 family)